MDFTQVTVKPSDARYSNLSRLVRRSEDANNDITLISMHPTIRTEDLVRMLGAVADPLELNSNGLEILVSTGFAIYGFPPNIVADLRKRYAERSGGALLICDGQTIEFQTRTPPIRITMDATCLCETRTQDTTMYSFGHLMGAQSVWLAGCEWTDFRSSEQFRQMIGRALKNVVFRINNGQYVLEHWEYRDPQTEPAL